MEGSKGQRATSATLLNQAMSFAAVAGVTMRLGTEAVIRGHASGSALPRLRAEIC